MFSIRPADHAMEHVKTRTQKLLLTNEIRVMELLESIQYGVLYLVLGFGLGVTLDYSFPNYNEQTKTSILFTEVALQCLILIILTFYLRKIVKIVPFLFVIDFSGQGKSTFRPYEGAEYSGEVIIALVFLGAQFNLIKKLDLLSRRFYTWLYNEEKAIGESLGI